MDCMTARTTVDRRINRLHLLASPCKVGTAPRPGSAPGVHRARGVTTVDHPASADRIREEEQGSSDKNMRESGDASASPGWVTRLSTRRWLEHAFSRWKIFRSTAPTHHVTPAARWPAATTSRATSNCCFIRRNPKPDVEENCSSSCRQRTARHRSCAGKGRRHIQREEGAVSRTGRVPALPYSRSSLPDSA